MSGEFGGLSIDEAQVLMCSKFCKFHEDLEEKDMPILQMICASCPLTKIVKRIHEREDFK